MLKIYKKGEVSEGCPGWESLRIADRDLLLKTNLTTVHKEQRNTQTRTFVFFIYKDILPAIDLRHY